MNLDAPNLDPRFPDKASQEKSFWHRLTTWLHMNGTTITILVAIAGGLIWFGRLEERTGTLRQDIGRIENNQDQLAQRSDEHLDRIGKRIDEHLTRFEARLDRLLLKQITALPYQGKILQVDTNTRSLTIETIPPKSQKLEVALAPGWKCIYKSKEVKLTDLKAGMYASITTDDDGKAVLVHVFDTKEELLKSTGHVGATKGKP